VALSRIQSSFSYSSSSGGQSYYFTVLVDESGLITVGNIQSSSGAVCDSTTGVPQTVLDDIQTAIGQVETLMSLTSAANGTVTFVAQTYVDIVFVEAMSTTSYRVTYSKEDFIQVRTINKTLTGFRIEVGSTYSGDIGWDVFV